MFAMGPESNIEVLQNRIIVLSATVTEQTKRINQLEELVRDLHSKIIGYVDKEESKDNNDY